MTDPLITAEKLSRSYRTRRGMLGAVRLVRAVDDVSFSIARGQTLGVVGESGSGKSTLGRMALGIETPDEGLVRFDAAPMPTPGSVQWRSQRARMQMIYQDPLGALDRRLSAVDQVEEPLAIHGIGSSAGRRDRALGLLAQVGLSKDQAQRFPHELSGGQRQRVVLARALVSEPEFLVCDEPVSALDVSIQAQIVNLLVDLQIELGLAMMFISHDLRVVRQVSNRVAVMYLGNFVEEGDADQVFADPIHPYTKALVSAAPSTDPAMRRERIVLEGEPPDPSSRPTGCSFHPRCPMAIDRCAVDKPVLRPIGHGRSVACHLAPSAFPSMVEAA